MQFQCCGDGSGLCFKEMFQQIKGLKDSRENDDKFNINSFLVDCQNLLEK
jgi:hypothetical protein